MRISAKIIKNVYNVNSWVYTTEARIQAEQANSFYIQLVDLDHSVLETGEKYPAFPEFPIRYISSATTLSVIASFLDLEETNTFEITGSQPFSTDKSIWKFDLTSAQIPKSGNLKLILVEDSIEKPFIIKNAIVVDSLEVGSC